MAKEIEVIEEIIEHWKNKNICKEYAQALLQEVCVQQESWYFFWQYIILLEDDKTIWILARDWSVLINESWLTDEMINQYSSLWRWTQCWTLLNYLRHKNPKIPRKKIQEQIGYGKVWIVHKI